MRRYFKTNFPLRNKNRFSVRLDLIGEKRKITGIKKSGYQIRFFCNYKIALLLAFKLLLVKFNQIIDGGANNSTDTHSKFAGRFFQNVPEVITH